jgi:hypothetical protein
MYLMTLLQAITPQGAISADWTLVIMVGIVGILILTICSMVASHFIGTLKRIDRKLSEHDNRMDNHEERLQESETSNKLLAQSLTHLNDKVDPNKTAELIWVKIKAAQGGHGK